MGGHHGGRFGARPNHRGDVARSAPRRVASVLAVDDETGLASARSGRSFRNDATGAPRCFAACRRRHGAGDRARRHIASAPRWLRRATALLVQPDGPAELNDGAPLTDQNGAVVGLCSRSADGRTRALDLSSVRRARQGAPWRMDRGVGGELDRRWCRSGPRRPRLAGGGGRALGRRRDHDRRRRSQSPSSTASHVRSGDVPRGRRW